MAGSHFALDHANSTVKPVQKPMPPIWIGANADAAVRRAARLGDCWYVNPHSTLTTLARQMDLYRRELDRCGKPFPAELPMRREVFVARTRAGGDPPRPALSRNQVPRPTANGARTR